MVHIDTPPVVDEQEATALMLHHLRLAASYFEATPLQIEVRDEFSAPAIKAWLNALEGLYPKD